MDYLFWVVGGCVAAYLAAKSRGRTGWWFLLGWIGLACVLVMPSRKVDPEAPTPETHVRCPDCRELVRMDASKCKHCGSALQPQVMGSAGDQVPLEELVELMKGAVRADDPGALGALLAKRPAPAALQGVRDYADLYGRPGMVSVLDEYMGRA